MTCGGFLHWFEGLNSEGSRWQEDYAIKGHWRSCLSGCAQAEVSILVQYKLIRKILLRRAIRGLVVNTTGMYRGYPTQ